MDDFRKATVKMVGPGGRGCPCCYDFHGSEGKKILRRIARAVVKRNTRAEINEGGE